MFRKIVKPLFVYARPIQYRILSNFCTNNKESTPNLLDQMHMLADGIPSTTLGEDHSDLANKYIQLTEQSFTQFATRSNANPQMMLMMLSTFEDPKKVADFLPLIYPSINLLEKTEMLLLLEKVLAYKPVSKPKIPHPKPLEDIESVLVILSELYNCDSLIDWIKYVPMYQGNSTYVLSMGYFSILQKMSGQVKNRNRALLVRCHQRLSQTLADEFTSSEQKVGMVSLALELNYGQALPLFFSTQIDYAALDPYKLCLLFGSLSKYLAKEAGKDNELRNMQREKAAQQEIKEMLKVMEKLDFSEFMKIEVMMDLWRAFLSQQSLKGNYLVIVDRISKICVEKDFQISMKQLSVEELLVILECMEKHKINKQRLLKNLLVYFSKHLHTMEKEQFIRLLRCLVTFVRQCEEYLLDVGRVLEMRKFQFSEKDAAEINSILRRVSVLFPKPFVSG